jgi:hypothetical protein
MEPDWTKAIPSTTVCNFFYAFFILYAVFFALSLLLTVGGLVGMKKMGPAGFYIGFQGLLMTGIAGTMMLFYYLICDRALLATKVASEGFRSAK